MLARRLRLPTVVLLLCLAACSSQSDGGFGTPPSPDRTTAASPNKPPCPGISEEEADCLKPRMVVTPTSALAGDVVEVEVFDCLEGVPADELLWTDATWIESAAERGESRKVTFSRTGPTTAVAQFTVSPSDARGEGKLTYFCGPVDEGRNALAALRIL